MAILASTFSTATSLYNAALPIVSHSCRCSTALLVIIKNVNLHFAFSKCKNTQSGVQFAMHYCMRIKIMQKFGSYINLNEMYISVT